MIGIIIIIMIIIIILDISIIIIILITLLFYTLLVKHNMNYIFLCKWMIFLRALEFDCKFQKRIKYFLCALV
jgi:competence protein ComGF